jgi:hypothetical protein
MDDLEINSVIPLAGTNMSNSATDLHFKVIEPNGITLINKLYQAVSSLYKQAQPVNNAASNANTNTNATAQNPNYPMAQYCMVVHFYGYDSNGNLVAPVTGSYIDLSNNISQTAVIEKYYPFVITNIKFRIANKQIEYQVAGKPIPHFYNFGTDRGTIPFNFNLAGQTVGQILIGKPSATQTLADPGARVSAPRPTNISATTPATASIINNVVNSLFSGVATSTSSVQSSTPQEVPTHHFSQPFSHPLPTNSNFYTTTHKLNLTDAYGRACALDLFDFVSRDPNLSISVLHAFGPSNPIPKVISTQKCRVDRQPLSKDEEEEVAALRHLLSLNPTHSVAHIKNFNLEA